MMDRFVTSYFPPSTRFLFRVNVLWKRLYTTPGGEETVDDIGISGKIFEKIKVEGGFLMAKRESVTDGDS